MKFGLKLVFSFLCVILFKVAVALPFGTFDPRSMAMGGTGTASATSSHAVFYNPALMSTYHEIKEIGKNSRFSLPVVSVRVSNGIYNLADIADQNYKADIRNAISNFNSVRSNLALAPAAAQDIVDITGNIQNDLNELSNKNHILDVMAGLVIGIPGDREGGSFFAISRAVGGGRINLSAADRQLLNSYHEGLLFIASGGTRGQNQPQLFTNGSLTDQSNNLSSTASARGLFMTELGLSFSKEYTFFEQELMVGISPKAQLISTFDYTEDAGNNQIKITRQTERKTKLNADLGLAKEFLEKFRAAVVVKNIYPYEVKTRLNNRIKLQPSLRGGFSYFSSRWVASADLDLWPDSAAGSETDSQQLALGVEWSPVRFMALRGGYRHDIQQIQVGGPFSIGMGFAFGSFRLDFAYAYGEQETGAALQLGVQF